MYASNKVKNNLIADTKAQFQRFSETPLSVADVDDIECNLLGVMKLLLEWQKVYEEEGGV